MDEGEWRWADGTEMGWSNWIKAGSRQKPWVEWKADPNGGRAENYAMMHKRIITLSSLPPIEEVSHQWLDVNMDLFIYFDKSMQVVCQVPGNFFF